jgi:hypothetical protein
MRKKEKIRFVADGRAIPQHELLAFGGSAD